MINDVQLEIKGLNPDFNTKKFISVVAEKINLSAPSDSIIKLVIDKSKKAIRASCRVVSQTGVFFADAVGENPIKAIQLVENKIRDQLDEWKTHRFKQSTDIVDLKENVV